MPKQIVAAVSMDAMTSPVSVQTSTSLSGGGAGAPANVPHSALASGEDAFLSSIGELSDVELSLCVQRLNQTKHQLDADLLLYLSEFDFRKLYREAACPSFFDYLTIRLGYSEDAAYRRMWCARLLRAYPLVHELIRSGQIHMAALLLLKPLLTPENHRELLIAASGKSKREVEKLVATRNPKPNVSTRIRRRPAPKMTQSLSPLGATTAPLEVSSIVAPCKTASEASAGDESRSSARSRDGALANVSRSDASAGDESRSSAPKSVAALREASAEAAAPSRSSDESRFDAYRNAEASAEQVRHNSRRTKFSPLSESEYRVTFTASERLKQKLDRARELMSHACDPSDLPALLERALDLLIERAERRRFGAKRSSRQEPSSNANARATEPDATGARATEVHAATRDATKVRATEPDATGARATKPDATGARAIRACTAKSESRNDHGFVSPNKVEDGSAYIPAAVRREVWERDGGRCTYVNTRGQRCPGRHYLQFDHRISRALDGTSTVENLRLRCAAHNALAAEEVFGRDRVRAATAAAQDRPVRVPKSGCPGTYGRAVDGFEQSGP
jgi:hypothetical protein